MELFFPIDVQFFLAEFALPRDWGGLEVLVIGNLRGRLKRLWAIKWLRRIRHKHRFWKSSNLMQYGVFQSFKEALDVIPEGKVVGWNHLDAATMPVAPFDSVNARDYPVLLWMRNMWEGEVRVFDYGGHVGQKRYAFERYLKFDTDKHWVVYDVMHVVQEGRKIAGRRNPMHMSFTDDFQRASECTLLLCLGVLQFVEEPLVKQLKGLDRLPPHLIVNGLPLHPDRSYVTLQNNNGIGFSPYKVFRRDDFIESIESIGYRLVDCWSNLEKSCWVSVDEEYNVAHYSGLYFRRS